MNALIKRQISNYRRWDFVFFTLITLLSVLSGETTVFYLIYFFWWNELCRLIIDGIFAKRNPNATIRTSQGNNGFASFFIMFVYFVFIVVFFGIIGSHSHDEIFSTNMGILFFQNWFFNANLIFIILERIFLHLSKESLVIHLGGFTPNMIVLHISIILGALLILFVVKRFPDVFTPDNFWGSVVIVLPFLILKAIVSKLGKAPMPE
jgi:hypothetical protein